MVMVRSREQAGRKGATAGHKLATMHADEPNAPRGSEFKTRQHTRQKRRKLLASMRQFSSVSVWSSSSPAGRTRLSSSCRCTAAAQIVAAFTSAAATSEAVTGERAHASTCSGCAPPSDTFSSFKLL